MHRRMHVFPPGYYESLGLGLMSGVITLEVCQKTLVCFSWLHPRVFQFSAKAVRWAQQVLYVAGVVLSLVLAIRTAVVVGRTARHPLAFVEIQNFSNY